MNKKGLFWGFTFFTSFIIGVLASVSVYAAEIPSRTINVVYDDSGSMIETNGQTVDTWCQAKYSMEVFAAMLGNKDTMNVYYMSDYDGGRASKSPRLTLKGSDGAKDNVKRIHEMVTDAANTPFNSVRKAYEDLIMGSGDEKWLVILTDGEFNSPDSPEVVESYINKKRDDVNVLFLGMGSSAASIKSNPEKGIYYEKASTNKEILKKITEICTRIFNSNKIEVDSGNKVLSFDVPMSELIVFAQGENVEIRGLTDSEGNAFSNAKEAVTVKYSETPATNYSNYIVDKKLSGKIAVFSGDFTAGDYTVDVSGAETIEVYYKPNIEIMAYLTDSEGGAVAYNEGVRAGEYVINFGFVKSGTDESVPESSLLGSINYQATVEFNGNKDNKQYSSGDRIIINEGEYFINVKADYLKYNTVDTEMRFEVFKDKAIAIVLDESPDYNIDTGGIANGDEKIIGRAKLEGAELTQEQWGKVDTVKIEQTGDEDKRVELIVEKTDSPGVFVIFPKLNGDKPVSGDYKDIGFKVVLSGISGKESWNGETDGTVKMTDNRNWLQRHADLVIKLIIIAIILLVILGYVPGIKKYLPKKLKVKPTITIKDKVSSFKTTTDGGRFVKHTASTVIPYKAQTGHIRFVPTSVSGVPQLKVKACGSNKMEVTNLEMFRGKNNILFNGEDIDKDDKKKKRFTAGLNMTYKTASADYECSLNR